MRELKVKLQREIQILKSVMIMFELTTPRVGTRTEGGLIQQQLVLPTQGRQKASILQR